jgi:Sec-independent protein translocase protein TatA
MKTNIPALRLIPAAILAFALTGATLRADDEGSTATAKLSAPGKPATLRLDVPWADIHITGVDGDTVTVASTLSQKNKQPAKPGSMRRLDDEVTFELTEHDNVVTLNLAGESPWAGHDAEFKISVPRGMALELKTDMGGDLSVKNTDGDIVVESMNGDVVLDGISGSTVVKTMNGEVRVNYTKAPAKLVNITSMNGEINLRVPADTKANVRMNTHNGSIMTDFDEDVLKTKTESSKRSSYSYAYSASEAGREAARAAMETSRDAIRAATEAAREAKREVDRAQKEADEAQADKEAAEATATPTAALAPMAPIAPHTPRTPRPPIATITGGKVVTGTLNGGGVDIKLSSMNGEITLRQSK